jgi:hypothetical protein
MSKIQSHTLQLPVSGDQQNEYGRASAKGKEEFDNPTHFSLRHKVPQTSPCQTVTAWPAEVPAAKIHKPTCPSCLIKHGLTDIDMVTVEKLNHAPLNLCLDRYRNLLITYCPEVT